PRAHGSVAHHHAKVRPCVATVTHSISLYITLYHSIYSISLYITLCGSSVTGKISIALYDDYAIMLAVTVFGSAPTTSVAADRWGRHHGKHPAPAPDGVVD